MDARPTASPPAAAVVLAASCSGAGPEDAASRRRGPLRAPAAKACVKPRAAQRRHHPCHRLPDRHPREAAQPVPDVKITVEDDAGKVVGNGTSNETGIFDIPLPGSRSTSSARPHGQDRQGVPAEGRGAAEPEEGRAEAAAHSTPTSTSPSRSAPSTAETGQADPGACSCRRRHRVLAAARDGRPRPVDDLRHHRPDELRARRADHVRSAGRLRRRLAPRHDHVGGANITIAVAIFAAIAAAGLRVAEGHGALAATAQPRHRSDRDDDRQHRALDLPAQPVPVRRRRRHPPVLPVLHPRSRGTSARSWSRRRTSASRCSPRSSWSSSSSRCSAPGSARRPARWPTTRRWPRPRGSTSTG